MKRLSSILFAAIASTAIVLACASCETFKKHMHKPQCIITLNQIVKYQRASRLEKEISTVSGENIWINVNPYLHSKSIKEIELLPIDGKPNYFDLLLHLDYQGKLTWMQISSQFAHEKMAFIIDGVCYKTFIPERVVFDDEKENVTVKVKGPFEKTIAEELQRLSVPNYEYYHRND